MVTLELTFKVKRKEESDRNVLYSKKKACQVGYVSFNFENSQCCAKYT